MNVLCNACPVIFLEKINQLNLIFELFPGEIVVPRIIKSEICTPLLPPAEEKATIAFLNKWFSGVPQFKCEGASLEKITYEPSLRSKQKMKEKDEPDIPLFPAL